MSFNQMFFHRVFKIILTRLSQLSSANLWESLTLSSLRGNTECSNITVHFNIYLCITHINCCTRHLMKSACLLHKTTRSTNLQGVRCLPELAFTVSGAWTFMHQKTSFSSPGDTIHMILRIKVSKRLWLSRNLIKFFNFKC